MGNPYQAPTPGGFNAAAATGGEYEFDAAQNQHIEKTGRRTRLWGFVALIGGILGLVLTVSFIVALQTKQLTMLLGSREALISTAVVGFLAPMALVHSIVGRLYIQSGNAFLRVVTSSGNDVHNLTQAIDRLGSAFRLEVILSIASFAIGLLLAVLILVGAMVLR